MVFPQHKAEHKEKRRAKHVEWSPYGCQFYPPATAELAALNIDSLPKEPLATGEQYFIDLAGNIKKVRISSVLCVVSVVCGSRCMPSIFFSVFLFLGSC